MIYHTINTITIENFGMGFREPSKIKRIPIPWPKKWEIKAFKKLADDYNKITNKDQIDDILEEKYHALKLGLKIEKLNTMFIGIEGMLKIFLEPDPDMLVLFKEYFRKDFEINDLERILREIKKLRSKYNAIINKLENLYQEQKENKPDEINNFEIEVIAIESWLSHSIGSAKLYKMSYYINKAVEIKKQRTPQNG